MPVWSPEPSSRFLAYLNAWICRPCGKHHDIKDCDVCDEEEREEDDDK
jgi:recombinational DNA repair protein RecR